MAKLCYRLAISVIVLLWCRLEANAWDYIDDSTWGAEFPQCNGNYQSPISLDPLSAKAIRSTGLTLSPECNFAEAQNFTVINANYTFRVLFNTSLGCKLSYSGSPPATLDNVEFLMGSEHAIEGSYFGMESQWSFKRGNGSEVRLSLMLGANYVDIPRSGPRTFFETVMNSLPVGVPETQVSLPSATNFTDWITGRAFFTYQGSLTVPPCTEGVSWVVVKDPVHIPRLVHLRFANAMRTHIPNFDDIGGNARDLRPLNGREVVYHVTSTQVDLSVVLAKRSRNTHIVIIVMAVAIGVAVMALWGGSRIDALVQSSGADAAVSKEAQQV